MPTERICSIEECSKPVAYRGYCESHYSKLKRHGDPLWRPTPRPQKICSVDGCQRKHAAKGLCGVHYQDQLYAHTPCSVATCSQPVRARGLCSTHYARWKRNGDPVVGQRTPNGKPRRFIAKVLTHSGDECVLWPYGSGGRGYGGLHFEGRKRGAHQVVCQMAHGPRPSDSHEVAHGCGNPMCVNPRHLRWATGAENQADRFIHGTAGIGEKHPRSKLTEASVREIRTLQGSLTLAEIAKRYGVNATTIHNVLTRRNWSWLE